MKCCLDNAVFTYFMGNKRVLEFSNYINIDSKLCLNYSDKTQCLYETYSDASVLVLGFCIDSRNEINQGDLCLFIYEMFSLGKENLMRACDRFAGNYTIFVFSQLESGSIVFTDAVGLMQLSYYSDTECKAFSSHPSLISKYLSIGRCPKAQKISLGARTETSPLPYNITDFKNVYVLLPNHYLDVNKMQCKRYWPNDETKKEKSNINSPENILDLTYERIKCISEIYAKSYSLSCALTGGFDSRVVFSFLKGYPSIQYYTLRHSLDDDHGDIAIPKLLQEKYSIPYKIVENISIDQDCQDYLDVNAIVYPRKNAELALSILRAGIKTTVNGNIIEQVARNNIGKDAPSWLIFPEWVMARSYNYSLEFRNEIVDHLHEIKMSGNHKRAFDLLSWELLCGRWVSQANLVYSLLGLTSLNIFNCREVIIDWLSISRATRKKNLINRTYLLKNDSKLLDIPINPGRPMKPYKNSWLYGLVAAILHKWF